MRIINNSCLLNMTSPIKYVMEHIPKALINIAPENSSHFDLSFPEFTIEYLDSSLWQLNVRPNEKHIVISRGVVELYWRTSYAYIVFYKKIMEGKIASEKLTVNLKENAEVKRSMQLLEWAYNIWFDNSLDDQFPKDLPLPIESPDKSSWEYLADELCLSIIAYLLHHELAHIKLLHSGKSEIESEKEADTHATDWLLNHSSLDEKGPKFIKRALAITFAFEVQTAKGMYMNDFGGNSHPFSYDRLYQNLNRHISNPNHEVWSTLSAILTLHLCNSSSSSIKISNEIIHNSHKDCVNYYIDLFSKIAHS